MNTKSAIKSLNLTGGEVLTLEKAKDRMEFEALPVMGTQKGSPCTGYACVIFTCVTDWCVFDNIMPCDCNGPVGYIAPDDCRPFKDCSSNNCRPVQ